MKILLLPIMIFFCTSLNAQNNDTLKVDEIRVNAYFSEQSISKLPASISIIDQASLQNQAPFSLVPVLNSVPGVRLEERSPASYRLSIRGSVLRSPFGVRNVKVYLDDFVFTDASGNSYLNILDAGGIAGIEIIKGPEGSIYGANTGGVVLLKPFNTSDSLQVKATLSAGSYETYLQRFSFYQKKENYQLSIQQGIMEADGFREQSKAERKYFQLVPQWNYRENASLKALLLFSDLAYQTPGGLTLEQMEQNPRSARAIALTQKAKVYNKTLFTGFSHEYQFSNNLRHVASATVSQTDFRNPFVTNYELRDERTFGLRTFAEWHNNQLFPLTIQAGFEAQRTNSKLQNFVNESGTQGQQQKGTDLEANMALAFAHLNFSPVSRLMVEGAMSYNKFNYRYGSFFPTNLSENTRDFKSQLMPRLAVTYELFKGFSLRVSSSRGFSTPTLEEVNPSGTSVNTQLQAENGWNREAGFRTSVFNKKLYWDLVVFDYRLNQAIVRGVNPNETDYYVNAGSTNQKGVESEITLKLIPSKQSGLFRALELRNSSTFYQFRFGSYTNGNSDYSGKKLTGVPDKTIVSSVHATLIGNMRVFLQHNYTAELPLNDANTVWANNYHLMNAKLTWTNAAKYFPCSIFIGAENLLNEKYSLGNDLNALGGRFFNPAAGRNYYLGVIFNYRK